MTGIAVEVGKMLLIEEKHDLSYIRDVKFGELSSSEGHELYN